MIKKIIIFLFCIMFFYGSAEAGENDIRVLLLEGRQSFSFSLRGYYNIVDLNTNTSVYKGKNIHKAKISCSKTGIKIGALQFNKQNIEIKPQQSGYIYINKRRYRGSLRIIKTEDSKLNVINKLDIEDYLRGVLAQEVDNRWPMHILMAQAITARSFALYQKQISKSSNFDVTDTVSSQMYGGMYSETWKGNRAVVKTKGKVLTFEGKVFPAYYHATCAGYTERAGVLWNIDIAPLKGRVCSFCKSSPHFNWDKIIPFNEIEEKLKIKGLKDIIIVSKNDSGRISQLKIVNSENTKEISAKEFRQNLGPDLIRSTNFSVEIKDNTVYFKGHGWGHGVGLCQWGAYKMAELGYSFQQILSFYYPESKIEKIY